MEWWSSDDEIPPLSVRLNKKIQLVSDTKSKSVKSITTPKRKSRRPNTSPKCAGSVTKFTKHSMTNTPYNSPLPNRVTYTNSITKLKTSEISRPSIRSLNLSADLFSTPLLNNKSKNGSTSTPGLSGNHCLSPITLDSESEVELPNASPKLTVENVKQQYESNDISDVENTITHFDRSIENNDSVNDHITMGNNLSPQLNENSQSTNEIDAINNSIEAQEFVECKDDNQKNDHLCIYIDSDSDDNKPSIIEKLEAALLKKRLKRKRSRKRKRSKKMSFAEEGSPNHTKKKYKTPKSDRTNYGSESEQEFEDVAEILAVSKRKQVVIAQNLNTPGTKVTQDMLKEQVREKKRQMKNLIRQKNAQIKGDLQYVTVSFDAKFQTQSYFQDLVEVLMTKEIKFALEGNHASPLSIKWQREMLDGLEGTPSKACTKTIEEDVIFVLIPISDVIPLITAFKSNPYSAEPQNWLRQMDQSHKELNPGCRIWYMVVGVKQHFKRVRQRHKKQPATECVSDLDVEEALLTFKHDLNLRISSLDTMEEVGNHLVTATKSIAQARYKKEKKRVVSWFAPGDTQGMIKMDKDGKGAFKLWKQQLLQFNHVGKEVAEAIASRYPSPQYLLEAYKECMTEKEAVNLLKTISVSRGIGSATTTRCIGPKLASKLYRLLISQEPNLVLK